MSLAQLFPDDDYRFQMRFKRGAPQAFFMATAEHESLMAERRRWLRVGGETYAAVRPDGAALLDEAIELARAWQGFAGGRSRVKPRERCLALGEFWEPDFLLLKHGDDGEFRLLGGCLCFPSSWRLSDKMGMPIEFIHEPVPGLNESIGPAINRFLKGIKPGSAWLRHNWGLARDAELNHHPDRGLRSLDASVRLEEVFLRVEHQALVALPESAGILFGIRVVIHPLAEVKADRVARARLHRALETMPEAMAVYKGIAAARKKIHEMLLA